MKILFYSPHALADSSSGAAQSVSNMLAELVRLGHSCAAVTGSLVDAKNELYSKVLEATPAHQYTLRDVGLEVPVRKVSIHGVVHVVAGFKSSRIHDLRASEETVLYKVFLEVFRDFDPEVVLGYGGFASNYAAGSHALAHGRKSIIYVASESYKDIDHFAHGNMVVTVSRAMANNLAPVTRLPTLILRPFIDRAAVVSADRKPEFISFLNPQASKGLRLVAALASESAQRNRPYKFLIVEGRGTRDTIKALCPEVLKLPNVSIAKNTSDVRLVYERTAIILYPSLWFETAGKVVLEANANGIPVLASNIGGISEMMDGAGYLFDPPAACIADWETPCPPDYMAKWLAILDRLHEDPSEMADAVRRARAADARYDPTEMAQKFISFAAS